MNRVSALALLILLLSACNPFHAPVHTFALIGYGEGGVMTCPLVRFRAELDGRVVPARSPNYGRDLDGTWVHNPMASFANLTGSVPREAGWPGRGAPFEVRIDCLDESQEVVGVSVFRGRLVAPHQRTNLEVLNFAPPSGSTPCLPPTEGSGVTLCAIVEGFALD